MRYVDTHLYTALQAIILAHTSIDTTLRDVLPHRHSETGEAYGIPTHRHTTDDIAIYIPYTSTYTILSDILPHTHAQP